MNGFEQIWEQAQDDLGFNDINMRRDRPYNGQPHTDTGIRGATEIKGVTFRDLHDCFIRAVCLSSGPGAYYTEADKGEAAALCENDVYDASKRAGGLDLMAVCQNLSCELERLMGIFPNVPKLEPL